MLFKFWEPRIDNVEPNRLAPNIERPDPSRHAPLAVSVLLTTAKSIVLTLWPNRLIPKTLALLPTRKNAPIVTALPITVKSITEQRVPTIVFLNILAELPIRMNDSMLRLDPMNVVPIRLVFPDPIVTDRRVLRLLPNLQKDLIDIELPIVTESIIDAFEDKRSLLPIDRELPIRAYRAKETEEAKLVASRTETQSPINS